MHRSAQCLVAPIAIALLLALASTPSAPAQTFQVLYNFTGGQDGRDPLAGLSIDKAGNLYGTTRLGGSGSGAVFKLSHKGSGWIFSPLYSFTGGNDGAEPYARVIFGPDGSLYGTTNFQGNSGCYTGQGCGTVFNLKPPPRACTAALCPWTETVLYRFTGGSDGGNPWSADLVFDQLGNLYGTTLDGGIQSCAGLKSCGVVYELTHSNGGWTQSVLYSFTGGNDGGSPGGGVIFDQAGNLYGVTGSFGPSGVGAVYELTPSGSGWTESTIFDPQKISGTSPIGSLVFDLYGNLFGANYGDSLNPPWYPGELYEIRNSNGNWILQYTYDLNGGHPTSGVTMDAAGNLYGATYADPRDQGVPSLIYKLVPSNGSWNFSFVYEFGQGTSPSGVVVADASGNIYGTVETGGTYGYGYVFEITP